MYVILIGPPGVGKGTQSQKIVEKFGLAHVSTGDILRRVISQDSPLAQDVKRYIDNGQLVPDNVVLQLVVDRLRDDECAGGALLDGFPRTLSQADAFEHELQKSGLEISVVIRLVADEAEVRRRLMRRAKIEGRSDDQPETIKRRIQIYQHRTAPLLDYYREKGVLHEIDGMGTPEDVFARVCECLQPMSKRM